MKEEKYTVGNVTRGFRTVAVTDVKSLNAEARQFEHEKSGARVIHIACPDTENCFSICVPTPPTDDTGMPHILEHMTLAGSEKFPCKEPFFEMIKRSMATFINALTGCDMTYYPVSSNIHKDLWNLADVYFDAVFHPLLTRDIFRREAHHLAPADPEKPTGDLRIDGIVYSEMKGVFSDPESILLREAMSKLLPDTCLNFESGGDPEAIPDLTHEQLRAFHATRYHPSNTYIILYGDIPTDEYLAFLEPRLAEYTREEIPPLSPRQKHWSEPRFHSAVYPVDQDDAMTEKTYLMYAWHIGDSTNLAEITRLQLVGQLLFGHDGAPVKKAINDSHLAANVIMSGGDDCGLESIFGIAVDGSEPDRMEALRKVIFDALEDVASKPFDALDIKAAFQQVLYPCVEITSGYPLKNVFRISAAWAAGLNPCAGLNPAAYFEELRKDLEKDPMLLNKFIREKFIDNKHRLDMVLSPSKTCEAETEARLAARLKETRAKLSDEDMLAIAKDAEHLAESNAQPNTPGQLAALPSLSVAEIPAVPKFIPKVTDKISDCNSFVKVNDIPSNGVVYLAAAFNLEGLPADLWQYLSAFCAVVSEFGTKTEDFAATARRRNACTGSLSAGPALAPAIGDAVSKQLVFSMKTTAGTLCDALDVFEDALFNMNPEDRARMDDIILQTCTEMRSGFVQNANSTARVHSLRDMSLAGHLTNLENGLPALARIEKFKADPAFAYATVCSAFFKIRDFVLNRRRVNFAVTCPAEANQPIRKAIDKWLSKMADTPVVAVDYGFAPVAGPRLEGLSAPLQVSFSAFAIPSISNFDPEFQYLRLGMSLLSSDYMLPELRFKGNAYGASAGIDKVSNAILFSTYRDPHVAETLDVFRKAADFVKNANWTQTEIDNAILTIAKGNEKPFRPDSTTLAAFREIFTGVTDEMLTAQRGQLLSATPRKVKDVTIRVLEAGIPKAFAVFAASPAMLGAAKPAMGDFPVTPILSAEKN